MLPGAMRLARVSASANWICLAGMASSVWAGWQAEIPSGSRANSELILHWQAEAEELGYALPQTLTLALPSGATPSMEWSFPTETYTSASTWKARPPGPEACRPRLSETQRFRDLHIASLTWTPCRETSGGMVAQTRATLRLDLGLPGSDPRVLPGSRDQATEKFLASWIVNYEQSRQFRSKPAASLAKAGSGTEFWGARLPAMRLGLFTTESGIYAVNYAQLKSAGLPVDKIDTRYLRLWWKGKEIPLFISGNPDGRLHPGDDIEFIGSSSRGDLSHFSPYTRESAFFLTWEGTTPGLRAASSPAPNRDSARANPTSFRTQWHAEEDKVVLRAYSTAEENISDLGARVQAQSLSEFWFWERIGPEKDLLTLKFQLPFSPAGGALGEAQGKDLRIRIHLKGITNDIKADPDHHLRFLLNGRDISLSDGQTQDALWDGQASHLWVSLPLSIGLLKAGVNELGVQKVNDLKTSEGKPVEAQDAYVNWIELDFPARFSAVNGMARFSNAFSDSLGLRRFEVTGFAQDSLSLWDIRGRRLEGFDLRREAEGYTLRFSDSLVGHVDYLASNRTARLIPRLRLDTLPNLLQPAQGADWICITESPLLGKGLDSLVQWRKSQGLRTAVIQARHIYQAFGDGATHPEAIRDFVRHAYENWPRPAPTYLLLLGETSLWFDKLSTPFRPNWVPTHLIDIRGWGVAANDDYFAKVAGSDDVPDLMVGRIPVADKASLSQVVAKILRQEKERFKGQWANQALLVAGYEAGFSQATVKFQQRALGMARHTQRIDLYPQSPYFRLPGQRSDFFRSLDSGLAFVQFFGHGGGSVWSDAGILTLRALDQDSLRGDWALPLVSSITCLTGYFEDPYERSLGEEMLRRPRNGAAAFYGSSGYISSAAGQLLGDEMIAVALRGGPTTVGAIIHEAEMRVRQKSGDAFLPVLAEFNLLGDPAMGYGFPEVLPKLKLSPRFHPSEGELQLSGETEKVVSKEAVAQLTLGDSVVATAEGGMNAKEYAKTMALPAGDSPLAGMASVHVFADTLSEVLMGRFTTADWMVDSITLEPAEAGYGDSVKLKITLATPYDRVALVSGIAFFALGAESSPPFRDTDQRLLASEDGRHLETTQAFVLPTPEPGETPWPNLFVKLRLGFEVSGNDGPGSLSIDETTPHAFALKPRPRLSLRPKALSLPWQDSLGLWVHFQNLGPGPGRNAQVTVTARLPEGDWEDRKPYAGPLAFGQADSLWMPLPDAALSHPLKVSIIPENPADAVPLALSVDTNFEIQTKILTSERDSLVLHASGFYVQLHSDAQVSRRVFSRRVTMPGLPPHLQSPEGDSEGESFAGKYAYFLAAAAKEGGKLRLIRTGLRATPKAGAAAPLEPQQGWHALLQGQGNWLSLDTLEKDVGIYAGAGLYAYLANRDRDAPVLSVQSRGLTLWPDDYVPRKTSIDLLLQDGQGVDRVLLPPVLKSRGRVVDSNRLGWDRDPGLMTLARIQFTPDFESGADTLELTAYDVSGNRLFRRFPYRLGEALAIRNLGSYPNPFADTAIFAYSLTDYCERVSLTVYSRSGRQVRRLSDHHAVGYREVLWDGRTDGGSRIANGLYFLKVTATSGDRSQTALFKLFKKRRL